MISIDVGTKRICVCVTSGSGKALKLASCRVIPVNDEIISDDSITLNDCFSDYIQMAFDGINDKEVTVTFSMLPVIANEYNLPFISNKKKMDEMVKAKVFQTLSDTDYMTDYSIVDVFKADNAKQCTVSAYAAAKSTVQGAFEVIKQNGKIPKAYKITQDIALNYANTFLKEKTYIIANLSSSQIMLHLINQPNKIITRNTVLDKEGEFDILGAISQQSDENSIQQQAYSQISKLVQYQAIKYAGVPVDEIYIFGESADGAMCDFLKENLAQKVSLLQQIDLSLIENKNDVRRCFYAIYAAL